MRWSPRRRGWRWRCCSADCQPVLFADPEARGDRRRPCRLARARWTACWRRRWRRWRRWAPSAARIRAVIGPTISQRAYEVGPEFLDRFRDEDEAALRFFASGKGDRYLFDLPGYGLDRLRRLGWAGAVDPALHLFRPRAVLFLPPQRASVRSRLRPADLGDPALAPPIGRLANPRQIGRRNLARISGQSLARPLPRSSLAKAGIAGCPAIRRGRTRCPNRPRRDAAACKMPRLPPFARRIGARRMTGNGTNEPDTATRKRSKIMAKKRWMKSVLKAAAETKVAMPWERGARRAPVDRPPHH